VFTNADALVSEIVAMLIDYGLEPRVVDGPKVRFYARNILVIEPSGHRFLSVRSGGQNPHPFVECKGEASPFLCGMLRSRFDHRPARIDVAEDRNAKGLFHRLHRLSKRIAKRYGIQWRPDGDWGTPDAGRTIYLGSRSSQVFLRIYEKGIKYARELGIPLTDELRNWVRIEVEFKPQNPTARNIARTIEPAAIWGTAAWLADFAQEAFAMEAERVNINQRRESDQQRALRFMGSQYGSHLQALLNDLDGDLTAFGAAIADLAGIEHTHH
jgi:DNA relaxase NicK